MQQTERPSKSNGGIVCITLRFHRCFLLSRVAGFPKNYLHLACVITVLISVSSVLGNTLILSALRQCQSLHSPSKALLCSLALTDLVVGLVVLPLYFAYYLTIILEMPTYFCSIGVSYGRTASFIAAASLFTTVTIAAERFLAFQLRLRYRVIVTFKRVVFILVLEWIGAALWACSWFFSESVSVLIGAVILLTCCLLVPLCYLSIIAVFAVILHKFINNQAPVNLTTLTPFSTGKMWPTWYGSMAFLWSVTFHSYQPR